METVMRLTVPRLSLLVLSLGLTGCSDPAIDPEPRSPLPRDSVSSQEQPSPEVAEDPEAAARDALNTEIALASAVKRLCSSVLVSGRTVDHVMANELNNPALEAVDFSFDGDLVTASGSGQTRSALYR